MYNRTFFIICGCFISESSFNIWEIPYFLSQSPLSPSYWKFLILTFPSDPTAGAQALDLGSASHNHSLLTLNRKLMMQTEKEYIEPRTGSRDGLQQRQCPLSQRWWWQCRYLARYLRNGLYCIVFHRVSWLSYSFC